MNSIINILKPAGMTSHDVVSYVRKQLSGVKVGHTGTLDPAASGVLPLCLGKATRLSSFLMEGVKDYRGEITLGVTTDTLDGEGNILEINREHSITPAEIPAVLQEFKGNIEQVPPLYSAIKHQGKRLYKQARKNMNVEPESRSVTIFNIQMEEYIEGSFPRIIFDVKCSHGTYIRSLAKDVGEKLGVGGHLSFLVRTTSGLLDLRNSITLENFKLAIYNNELEKVLLPMDFAVGHLKKIIILNAYIKYFINGNFVKKDQVKVEDEDSQNEQELWRVYDQNEIFWGIGRWQETSQGLMLKPEKVLS